MTRARKIGLSYSRSTTFCRTSSENYYFFLSISALANFRDLSNTSFRLSSWDCHSKKYVTAYHTEGTERSVRSSKRFARKWPVRRRRGWFVGLLVSTRTPWHAKVVYKLCFNGPESGHCPVILARDTSSVTRDGVRGSSKRGTASRIKK